MRGRCRRATPESPAKDLRHGPEMQRRCRMQMTAIGEETCDDRASSVPMSLRRIPGSTGRSMSQFHAVDWRRDSAARVQNSARTCVKLLASSPAAAPSGLSTWVTLRCLELGGYIWCVKGRPYITKLARIVSTTIFACCGYLR